MAKIKNKVKLAVIRSDDEGNCPFGLDVSFGCKNAGELIHKMAPMNMLGDETTDEEKEQVADANKRLLRWHMPEERCYYAGKIFANKDSVECNWDSNAPGAQDEPGLQGSPFYWKFFTGQGLDGVNSFPLGYYIDNSIDRGYYYAGPYSIEGIASEKKKEIEKDSKQKTAVIIKGNPKYIKNNSKAAKFYEKLSNLLETLGYEVTFDPGESYTEPKLADIWVGHSRGVDRLRFAPKGIKTIGIGAQDFPGAINHPNDNPQKGKEPTQAHYELTDEMCEKLTKLIKNCAGPYSIEGIASDKEEPIRKDAKQIMIEAEDLNMANDSTNKITLRRLGPGLYSDGRFTIVRIVYPHNGEVAWYWQDGDHDVDDHYRTKWQALEALNDWVARGAIHHPNIYG